MWFNLPDSIQYFVYCREVFQDLCSQVFQGMTEDDIRQADAEGCLKLPAVNPQVLATALTRCSRTSTDNELQQYADFVAGF